MAATHTVAIFIVLYVITGNVLYLVVPKLVQKNLFEINLKKLFLIRCTKLKTFRLWVREK